MAVDKNPNKPGVQKKPPAKKPPAKPGANKAGAKPGGYTGPGPDKGKGGGNQGGGNQGGGGGGGGGEGNKRRVTDQWIKQQINKLGYKGQWVRGAPGFARFNKATLTRLATRLANEGLGKAGLKYLIQSKVLQGALSGMLPAVTPQHIRWAMANDIDKSGKDNTITGGGNPIGDAQSELLHAFPELWEQYMSKIPAYKAEDVGDERIAGILETFRLAGEPIPQNMIDTYARMGYNLSDDPEMDPRLYSTLLDYVYNEKGKVKPLNDRWAAYATEHGFDPDEIYEQQLALNTARSEFDAEWAMTGGDEYSDVGEGAEGTYRSGVGEEGGAPTPGSTGGNPQIGGFDVLDDQGLMELGGVVQSFLQERQQQIISEGAFSEPFSVDDMGESEQ